MTRFVVDCGVVLRLAGEGIEVPAEHRLLALLGDAVLRRRAWDLAGQLGWAETYDAEYVALTQLQADAFATLDAELARRVEGVVPTATIDTLGTPEPSGAERLATWRPRQADHPRWPRSPAGQ